MELTHRLELWSAVYETAALPVELPSALVPERGLEPYELVCRTSAWPLSYKGNWWTELESNRPFELFRLALVRLNYLSIVGEPKGLEPLPPCLKCGALSSFATGPYFEPLYRI